MNAALRVRDFTGVIGLLLVAVEVLRVEVHLAQVAAGVASDLIVEVLRSRVAAFAACGDGKGPDPGPELDDGYEAVAGGAIPALCAGIWPCPEGRERTPDSRGEGDGRTRGAIVEVWG